MIMATRCLAMQSAGQPLPPAFTSMNDLSISDKGGGDLLTTTGPTKFGGMRGHRGMVVLLVAFATGSSRAAPPTRFLVGTGSNLDEFDRLLASIESIVVEDTLPPPVKFGTAVAGPYMIRPRG